MTSPPPLKHMILKSQIWIWQSWTIFVLSGSNRNELEKFKDHSLKPNIQKYVYKLLGLYIVALKCPSFFFKSEASAFPEIRIAKTKYFCRKRCWEMEYKCPFLAHPCLMLLSSHNWYWLGFLGSLSSLVWAILYPLSAISLSWTIGLF